MINKCNHSTMLLKWQDQEDKSLPHSCYCICDECGLQDDLTFETREEAENHFAEICKPESSDIEYYKKMTSEYEQQLKNMAIDYEQQISSLTRDKAVLERALEIALDYFALLDNKIHLNKEHHLYGIFLHDDFSKAKWIAKAEQEHDPH